MPRDEQAAALTMPAADTAISERPSHLVLGERRLVWLFAALAFVSRLALLFRSDARIASRPYIEDAFYAFSCARELAMGHGFSVDGLHATNGVQPLICLLYASCFWLTSNQWLGLRLTFIVNALIAAVGVFFVAKLLAMLRRSNAPDRYSLSAPVAGAALWTVSIPLLIHHTNGLETGLYAVLLLASLCCYVVIAMSGLTLGRVTLLGVLLGLVVLARIDGVFFVAAIGAVELWRRRGHAIGRVVLWSVIAVLVSLPWWLYNFYTFGSLMPISGQSEAIGTPILENLGQLVVAASDIASVFFYHSYYASLWLNVAFVVIVGAFWIVIFLRRKAWSFLTRSYQGAVLSPLLIAGISLAIYYSFFFSAPHFMARYLEPLRLLWILIVAAIAPLLWERCRAWWLSGLPARLTLGALALVVVAFTCERYINNFTTKQISEFYRIGVWARERPSERIGMMQSGTASFVSPNVINLDGKVNSEALLARKHGSEGAFIAREHFDYLVDWPEFVRPLVEKAREAGVEYRHDSDLAPLEIYRRVP